MGRIPLAFEPGKPVLRDVMLSPDGRRVTVGGEGDAATWDLRSGKQLFAVRCGFWPSSVSLAGRGWYREPDPSNRFVLRELESGAVRLRADRGAATREWVIADDGRHVLYEGYGGDGTLLGTTDASEAPARLGEGRSPFTAAVFTPDARLAVIARDDATVRVWDVKTKTELDAVDLSASLDHANALAISKTGDELFVGTARGVVYRYSVSAAPRLAPAPPVSN